LDQPDFLTDKDVVLDILFFVEELFLVFVGIENNTKSKECSRV